MAEEKEEAHSEQPKQEAAKKGGSKKLIIIIVAAALALGGGGFFAYTMFSGKGKKTEGETAHKEEKKDAKTILISLDPFVLNLAEQGRFLKMTMQIEISDPTQQQMVTEKTPQLRDAIITLVSSKSAEALSSSEGKLQLKDDLLLRVNMTIGKDAVKNIFFTEFVMQ
jgi:flagellar FliL protein